MERLSHKIQSLKLLCNTYYDIVHKLIEWKMCTVSKVFVIVQLHFAQHCMKNIFVQLLFIDK